MSGLTLEVQPFGTGFKAILTDNRGRTFEAVASTRWAAEKQAAKRADQGSEEALREDSPASWSRSIGARARAFREIAAEPRGLSRSLTPTRGSRRSQGEQSRRRSPLLSG
jgi:hypothetical protein